MGVLDRVWEREVRGMSMAGKGKGMAEVIGIREAVKKGMLQLYLERCLVRHAMAYFQWRYRFKKDSNDSRGDILKQMFFKKAKLLGFEEGKEEDNDEECRDCFIGKFKDIGLVEPAIITTGKK